MKQLITYTVIFALCILGWVMAGPTVGNKNIEFEEESIEKDKNKEDLTDNAIQTLAINLFENSHKVKSR